MDITISCCHVVRVLLHNTSHKWIIIRKKYLYVLLCVSVTIYSQNAIGLHFLILNEVLDL